MIDYIVLTSRQLSKISSGEINNNWSSTNNYLGQFFFLILFVVVVLFFTYYFLKLSNKGKILKKGKNMEIIETLPLGYQTMIYLVKTGEKHILLGVNKDGITYLTDFEGEVKPREDFGEILNTEFLGLNKLMKNKK